MKFGSTWLKAALLGSAMLIASGVFAEGKKLTEKFDAGITATYSPEIANKDAVEAKEYTVTFAVQTGKELGEVKFNDNALTAEAGQPLVFKFTMPSDKDATLEAKLKSETPATGKKLTEQFDEGITATYTPAIADKNNVAAGEYTVKFTVAGGKELGEVKFNDAALTAEAGDPLAFKFTMPSDKEATLVAKVKGEAPKTHKLTIAKVEGATVTVTVDGKAVANEGQVAEGSKLVVDVKVTDTKKEVASVKLGETAATLKGDKYEVVMPKADATLTVTLKAKGTPKPGAVEDNAFAAVSVYPNPFADMLTVNEVAEASRVTLVNAQGVVLRSVAVNGANQIALDVIDVPAGIYMVVVENGAARRAFKVVK